MAWDDESLIILSDVHLGSDLVDHAPSVAARRRPAALDRDLVALVDHYRTEPAPKGRWRLVIAGDLIDFIGMALPPEQPGIETDPSEEETEHGLGSARDHTVAKARAVVERHKEVFQALARFVADGGALTVIHGNHDLELFWDEVRAELTSALVSCAAARARAQRRPFDRADFLERVEFNPWFFYRDGVAYIEHGHQYDAFCATEHLLAPLSPLDPRRVARGFCDILLRFVVRQTPGLTEHGHETMGILDYLRFGWRLGASGMVALAMRYARAIRELFRVRRGYLSEATAAVRAQHEQAMLRFARAKKLGVRRIRALWRLQVPPITRTISGILASLLVDRLMLGAGCITLLIACVVAGVFVPPAFIGVLIIPLLWALGVKVLSARRKVDPVDELVQRAAQVAAIFPAAFIVMGHTHVPAQKALTGGAVYYNVGCWAEDEEHGERACRGHLVIHPGEDRPVARFLRWDEDRGPTEL